MAIFVLRKLCCVRRTKIKNLKAIHNRFLPKEIEIKLCSKNKDKKSESNSQPCSHSLCRPCGCVRRTKIKNLKAIHNDYNSTCPCCIPYWRRPPPVRNMHSVLKKASWCTRRVFRSPPCSKQASGVQKGYSVPEAPFYGAEQAMCTGKGLLVYRLKRRNAAPALRLVILRKTAICMLLLLPLNSRSQLWAATKPLQTTASRCKSPQTVMDSRKLPLNCRSQLWTTSDYRQLR